MLRKKTIVSVVMALSIVSMSFGSFNTASAKYSKKVKNAYAKFLAKHDMKSISDDDFYDASYEPEDKSYVNSFTLHDFDKDGVPELVTETPVNFRWYIVRIYTYSGGKVKACTFDDGSEAVLDNCAIANGAYEYHICKKGHIHNTYSGSMANETDIYKVKKGVLTKVKKCSGKRVKVDNFDNTKKSRNKMKKL